jgi:hypothetical protein
MQRSRAGKRKTSPETISLHPSQLFDLLAIRSSDRATNRPNHNLLPSRRRPRESTRKGALADVVSAVQTNDCTSGIEYLASESRVDVGSYGQSDGVGGGWVNFAGQWAGVEGERSEDGVGVVLDLHGHGVGVGRGCDLGGSHGREDRDDGEGVHDYGIVGVVDWFDWSVLLLVWVDVMSLMICFFRREKSSVLYELDDLLLIYRDT